ncbi:Uncharacterised protein [Mycobacterium tuberculosis]|nr:Uncharacterised protein [Mycobacterium tuberculosis]
MWNREEKMADTAVLVFTNALDTPVGCPDDEPRLGDGREFFADPDFFLAGLGGCQQQRDRQSQRVGVTPGRLRRLGEKSAALGDLLRRPPAHVQALGHA